MKRTRWLLPWILDSRVRKIYFQVRAKHKEAIGILQKEDTFAYHPAYKRPTDKFEAAYFTPVPLKKAEEKKSPAQLKVERMRKQGTLSQALNSWVKALMCRLVLQHQAFSSTRFLFLSSGLRCVRRPFKISQEAARDSCLKPCVRSWRSDAGKASTEKHIALGYLHMTAASAKQTVS